MRRWLLRFLASVGALCLVAIVGFRWLISRPILPAGAASTARASVEADDFGVPTIRAGGWVEVVEAQGFVVASERMFQMDLIRRFSGGRLSELFGPDAIEHDSRRRREDWLGVAGRAAAALPDDERAICEAYAAGVNRFIRDRAGRWSFEYTLLRLTPEPWRCADSLLVLLSMTDQLAGTSQSDALRGAWRDAIGEAWYALLFSLDHPWNEPMFGTPVRRGPDIPWALALPEAPIGPDEGLAGAAKAAVSPWYARLPEPFASQLAALADPRPADLGSNSWAWCGETGCFLANDPHLGNSVPQTWFALRLEDKSGAFAVGVALPGIPGIVLGMNSHLAWAFTNVGEDIDDLLIERLSDDGARYLSHLVGDREVWAPIQTRTSTIVVKGAAPMYVTARFTHRGPLEARQYVKGLSSRRWLAFEPGLLRLPSKLIEAKDWNQLNDALDGMRLPAQNVLMVDREGAIGYRASGTGIARRADGQVPQPATSGDWIGLEPPEKRPRLLLTSTSAKARFLATANERMWISEYGHAWADEGRKERIRRFLSSSERLRQEDMHALQLDTESRFHRLLLTWVVERAEPKDANETATAEQWRRFSGIARDEPTVYAQALAVETAIESILVGRVRSKLASTGAEELPYKHRLSPAWILTVLETKDAVRVFGVSEEDLAQRLLTIGAAVKDSHGEQNRWAVQHPFAAKVPVIGKLFAISAPPQHGSRQVVCVETPRFGASVRVVWNLSDPSASRWSFPVGQSGHVGSRHYEDAREDWYAGRSRPVLTAH